MCGADRLCHAANGDCATVVDGGDASDAAEVPGIGADLIAWSGGDIEVAVSRSTRFDAPTSWFSTQFTFQGDLANLVCDVDGDGLADLVAMSSAGVDVGLSAGNAFTTPTSWLSVPMYGSAHLCGDVTGDGKADVIALDPDTNAVAVSNGTAFGTPQVWDPSPDAFLGDAANLVARLNSDAYADLVAWSGNVIRVKIAIPGNQFATAVTWYSGTTSGTVAKLAADVDGDGLDELIAWNTTNVSVYRINPTGDPMGLYDTEQWLQGNFGDSAARLAADVNADGLADLIEWTATGVRVAISTGGAFAPFASWSTAAFTGAVARVAANVDVVPP